MGTAQVFVVLDEKTPTGEKFWTAAQESGACLVLDGMKIYRLVANRIRPLIGDSGAFGAAHWMMAIDELQDVAQSLDVSLKFDDRIVSGVTNTEERYMALVASIVDQNPGIVTAQFKADLLEAALAAKWCATSTPIWVTSDYRKDVDRLSALCSGITTEIRVGNRQANKETIEKLFKPQK
jgi:hypothetical protein